MTSTNLFNEVPIETTLRTPTELAENKLSYSSIFITFMFYVVLQSSFIYTTLNLPPVINQTNILYPFQYIQNEQSSFLNISIGPFSPHHRTLSIEAAGVRGYSTSTEVVPITFQENITFSSEKEILKTEVTKATQHSIVFDPFQITSSKFLIYEQNKFTSTFINISMHITGSINNVTGLSITYRFNNQQVERYVDFIRLFVFSISIFSFVSFLSHSIKFITKDITSVFILCLFVSDVFGSNVLSFFVPSLSGSLDIFLQFTFILLYRAFIMMLGYSYIKNKQISFSQNNIIASLSVSLTLNVLELFVQGKYSMCSFAMFQSFSDIKNPVLHITGAVLCTIVVIFYVYVMLSSHTNNSEVFSYSFFISVAAFITFVSKYFLPLFDYFSNTVFPYVLYITSHLFIVSIFMFFQTTILKEYLSIHEKGETSTAALDVIYFEKSSSSASPLSYSQSDATSASGESKD